MAKSACKEGVPRCLTQTQDCCDVQCQTSVFCKDDKCYINSAINDAIRSYELSVDTDIVGMCTKVPVVVWEKQCKCPELRNITFNDMQNNGAQEPSDVACQKLKYRLNKGRATFECETSPVNGCCTQYKLKTLESEETDSNKIPTTAILGAVVGILFLIIVALLVMFLLYRRRKNKKEKERNNTTGSTRQQNLDRAASVTYATIDDVDLDLQRGQGGVENRSYDHGNNEIVKSPPTIVSRRPSDHNYVDMETRHSMKPSDITYQASPSNEARGHANFSIDDKMQYDELQTIKENSHQDNENYNHVKDVSQENSEDYDKLSSKTEKVKQYVGNDDYHHVKRATSEEMEDYDKLDSKTEKNKSYVDDDDYNHVKRATSEEMEDYDKLDSKTEKGKSYVDDDDYNHVKKMTSEESEDYDKLDSKIEKGKSCVDDDDYNHVKKMTSEESEDYDKLDDKYDKGKSYVDDDDYHHVKKMTSEESEDYDKLDSKTEKGKSYVDDDDYNHVSEEITEM